MYRYECPKCGMQKHIFHSMDEHPIEICDKCGTVMNRVFTNIGVIYKADGYTKSSTIKKIRHYNEKYKKRKKE